MKLNELPVIPGNAQTRKRKGQGSGSGLGKTAGRGQKGQKSRSGGYHKVGFEGGQMPLQRRLPKRGFRNPFRKEYAIVKAGDLEQFESGARIGLEELKAANLVGKVKDGVKLLSNGELTKSVTIVVDKASKAAVTKVEAAGGKVELPAATD